MIRTTNVRDGRIDLSECRCVEEATYERWTRRAKVLDGDVILTREAPIGEVGFVTGLGSVFLGQRIMQFRPDPSKIEPRYLYYAFRSPDLQHQFGMHDGSGSVVSHIRVADCHEFKVSAPPLSQQRLVVELLGSIDDKIELNRRMSETLEVMAQAIFRDWFVDFGPVRRKLAGETDPVAIMGGLTPDSTRAAELAAMFPDDLSDDHLPSGWATARVEGLLELTYGKSLPKPARRPGSVPVYGSGGVGGYHDTALVAGPGIIVGRKGTVGSLFWEPEPFFAIDTVFCVLPKPGVSLHFAWQLLHTLGLAEMNTDAAVPGLNRSNVYRLEVPRAPAVVLNAFEDVAGSLRSLLDANNAENRTLSETRDYLLPRLMSGAVRVSEALEQDAAA